MRYDRIHSGPASANSGSTSPDPRAPGAKDRDRILYSDPFRRLTGVTQVVGTHEGTVFHNRFTHSIKVGQIARRLAEKVLQEHEKAGTAALLAELGGLDPEVAEAAALAHDIGHPPFGHAGEEILDELVRGRGCHDGFEGNAQSFRIITKIATKGPEPDDPPGLDLSRATLRGTLKYPWMRELDLNKRPIKGNKHSHKWGAYDTESADFEFAMSMLPPLYGQRTLETEIMDWADDITYAVHDLEDFYRAGLIPLPILKHYDTAQDKFKGKAGQHTGLDSDKVHVAWNKIEEFLPDIPFTGHPRQLGDLAVMRSGMIEGLINAFTLSSTDEEVQIDERGQALVEVLKTFTWLYVIDSPDLEAQRFGHKQIITEVFDAFCSINEDGHQKDKKEFLKAPFFDREVLSDCHPARLAADYIASLSEAQTIQLHGRLTGHTLGSVRDLIV